MKTFTKILFFILISIKGFSQENASSDSLYIIALEKYSVEIDSFYNKYSSNKMDCIYIEETNLIKDIPDTLNGKPVVVLNWKNIKDIYKENNNNIYQLKIFPCNVKSDTLSITLTPYHGTYKRAKLNLALSDWTTVFFKYDCDTKKWVYFKTENNGI